MIKPKVAILKAEGTNFDEETKFAFDTAGADTDILLMSEVLENPKILNKYQILDFPGGFSYGDDLYSGKIWATQINVFLKDTIHEFISHHKIVIGICNGFQVLVRAGFLPGFGKINHTIGLIHNTKGKFECRWISLLQFKSRCKFLQRDFGLIGTLPVEHGEGRFIVQDKVVLDKLINNNQIVYRYVDDHGNQTMNYPQNPNGSINSIAGICDTTGFVFGMMPHPEHFMLPNQYPNWRRYPTIDPYGLKFYKQAVSYFN